MDMEWTCFVFKAALEELPGIGGSLKCRIIRVTSLLFGASVFSDSNLLLRISAQS